LSPDAESQLIQLNTYQIINGLADHGAEGVILGCTELPLLVTQEDVNIPLFDTTQIHAEYAVEFALKDYNPKNS